MTFKLYRSPIPDSALMDPRSDGRMRLSKMGIIDGGSSVDTVSSNPGEVNLGVVYRGEYADRLGIELRELLDAGKLQEMTLAPASGQSEYDGYYAAESSDSRRAHPESEKLVRVSGTLVREGTRASHRRAIKTVVTQPDPGNTFGNNTTAYVGVPSDATRVLWIDDEPASQTETPTVVSTLNARFGDVDLVDARVPSFDDPILVYDLPYTDQGDVDAGVWDTYNTASPTDANSVVQWGRVFDPEHDPRENDELVVENGLMRVWFDDADNRLAAESWNDGTGSWDSTSLGVSDWELLETDIRLINGARVEARVTFRDSTSPSTEHELDFVLPMGYEKALWLVPGSDSVPTGLSDLLDPIADEQVYVASPEFSLVAREDL